MQGNHDDFNELPSGTEFCGLNPKGSPFFPEFLSFLIFRVWVRVKVRVRIVVRFRF